MSINIIIFGVTHSGKSTLCGYLWSLMEGNSVKADQINKKLKIKLGEKYEASSYYRYLVDDSEDEIIRGKNDYGTSKKNHFRKIRIENIEITIIDAPGSYQLYKEINKGMFYADIGVFFVETYSLLKGDYLSEESYNEILRVLRLWSMFKKNIVIVLSKSDILPMDFNEEQYIEINKIMDKLCGSEYNHTKIVPISINVEEKYSNNILSSDDTFSWYNGSSFTEVLKEEMNQIEKENVGNLLFYIDRQYFNKKKNIGKTWRIKIISGILRTGDEVIVSPVFIGDLKKDLENVNVSQRVPVHMTATISSMHYEISKGEEPEEITSAGEGNIVGVTFSNIRVNERGGYNKKDIYTLSTSCGFSSKVKYKSSERLIIEIEDKVKVNQFSVNQQLNIMVFGRLISVKIEYIDEKENALTVIVLAKSKNITLPIINGEFLFNKIKVFLMDQFINAKVIDICESEKIQLV